MLEVEHLLKDGNVQYVCDHTTNTITYGVHLIEKSDSDNSESITSLCQLNRCCLADTRVCTCYNGSLSVELGSTHALGASEPRSGTVSVSGCQEMQVMIIIIMIMQNFNRRHGSKRHELTQHPHSHGSHAFTHTYKCCGGGG